MAVNVEHARYPAPHASNNQWTHIACVECMSARAKILSQLEHLGCMRSARCEPRSIFVLALSMCGCGCAANACRRENVLSLHVNNVELAIAAAPCGSWRELLHTPCPWWRMRRPFQNMPRRFPPPTHRGERSQPCGAGGRKECLHSRRAERISDDLDEQTPYRGGLTRDRRDVSMEHAYVATLRAPQRAAVVQPLSEYRARTPRPCAVRGHAVEAGLPLMTTGSRDGPSRAFCHMTAPKKKGHFPRTTSPPTVIDVDVHRSISHALHPLYCTLLTMRPQARRRWRDALAAGRCARGSGLTRLPT
jgi:hypothetical protein